MFKIRLPQNRESYIILGLGLGVALLFIINVVAIAPTMVNVFLVRPPAEVKQPLDAETINQALKILE